jgi:UDP-glucose 4-epimerase
LNHFIKKAITDNKLQVYGNGGPLRDHNYVENVVDALILAAKSENTEGKHYVLGSGEGNSFLDFLTTLKEILENKHGIKIIIEKVPTPGIVNKTAQGDVIVDFSQLEEDTGYIPKISFAEGLNETIEFYKKNLIKSSHTIAA